jgi:hypothetical protein
MKHILGLFFIAFLLLSTPSCSRKSGCPADSAQTQTNKHGEYKTSKTTSGLLPSKKNYKKKKGPYTKKKKVKHKN